MYSESHLRKSFYFRTHTEWNALPKEIREISNPSLFKDAVKIYFWKNVQDDCETLELSEFDLIDNG